MYKYLTRRITVVLSVLVFAAAIGCKSDSSDGGGGVVAFNNLEDKVVVSGSSNADVNGTYAIDDTLGLLNGYPIYKHAKNDIYIEFSNCGECWVINPSVDRSLCSYHRTHLTGNHPGCGLWEEGYDDDQTVPGKGKPTVYSLAIRGNPWVGQTLSAPLCNNPDVIYTWYRCDDAIGTNPVEIAGAASYEYTLTTDDVGKYISYQAKIGTAGTPVTDIVKVAIEAAPEEAYVVSGAGTTAVNGTYTLVGGHNNKPLYKHQSENFYIGEYGCGENHWSIQAGFGLKYMTIYSASPSFAPPLNGWDTRCVADGGTLGGIVVNLPAPTLAVAP